MALNLLAEYRLIELVMEFAKVRLYLLLHSNIFSFILIFKKYILYIDLVFHPIFILSFDDALSILMQDEGRKCFI